MNQRKNMQDMYDWVFAGDISGLWGYKLADILLSLGLVIVTLAMAVYLWKTFNSQIDATTMNQINQSLDNFQKHHQCILSDISRNFVNKDNPEHDIIKYDEKPLREFLNELESVCLYTKKRIIRAEFIFELFLPMLEPCLTDEQIRNEFGVRAYTRVRQVACWYNMYNKHPLWFKIRYSCRCLN